MESGNLIDEIKSAYDIHVQHIELHRDMIGKVYVLQDRHNRYVFKLYRSFKTGDAMQTVDILEYLQAKGYPAVRVVRTGQQDGCIMLNGADGCCGGILFEYMEGVTPDGRDEAGDIGKQVGELHQLMEGYPGQLMHRTKQEYIDDYISIMRKLEVHPGKVSELEQYGHELWERITRLPRSFSHGDLHTGNMLRNRDGDYVLLDFDDASGDYPIMDVAYMSDAAHFNRFEDSHYDETLRLLERFYSGYGKVRTISDDEFHAVFDFIAVRHYQIVSRIVACQGLQCVSKDFFDEQHDWLTRWRELCLKKGAGSDC